MGSQPSSCRYVSAPTSSQAKPSPLFSDFPSSTTTHRRVAAPVMALPQSDSVVEHARCSLMNAKSASATATATSFLNSESYASYPWVLREASSCELREVLAFYLPHAVSSCGIASVEVVENPVLQQQFRAGLRHLQAQMEIQASISPPWTTGHESKARLQVYSRLEKIAAPFFCRNLPALKFLPVWRRVSDRELGRILERGYGEQWVCASLEAEHAWQVFDNHLCGDLHGEEEEAGGALLLNWVGVGSIYPVVSEDRHRIITAKSNFGAHDALFIPTSPLHPPCQNGFEEDPSASLFHEVVVLDPLLCLPKFVVRLRPAAAAYAAKTKRVESGPLPHRIAVVPANDPDPWMAMMKVQQGSVCAKVEHGESNSGSNPNRPGQTCASLSRSSGKYFVEGVRVRK